MAESFLGLPAVAPLRSTTCRRRAPCATQCAAMAPGSSENTVAVSIAALLEAHALAVLEVDRRDDQHGAYREHWGGGTRASHGGTGATTMGGRERVGVSERRRETYYMAPCNASSPGRRHAAAGSPAHEVREQPRAPPPRSFRGGTAPRTRCPRATAQVNGERVLARARSERGVGRLHEVAVHEIEAGSPARRPPTGRAAAPGGRVPAHVRDLELRAGGVDHALGGKAPHAPAGARRGPPTSPSSLRSKSICRPMQMPRKGFVRAASRTAGRRPRASSSRMQSGMAPCPGNDHAIGAPQPPSGSLVTCTRAPGATCSSALATERRLPMP